MELACSMGDAPFNESTERGRARSRVSEMIVTDEGAGFLWISRAGLGERTKGDVGRVSGVVPGRGSWNGLGSCEERSLDTRKVGRYCLSEPGRGTGLSVKLMAGEICFKEGEGEVLRDPGISEEGKASEAGIAVGTGGEMGLDEISVICFFNV